MGTSKKEQERVGRAGSLVNLGPQLFRPVWHGCRLAFREIGNRAVSQVLAFWFAGGRGLVAPSGCLSVCATRFFRLRPGPWSGGLFKPAGVPTWCGASRGSPAAPSGLRVKAASPDSASGVIRALWPRHPRPAGYKCYNFDCHSYFISVFIVYACYEKSQVLL